MEKLTIEKLNQIYQDAEEVDKDLFAEQRSNILLSIGNHYSKKSSRFWSRIKDARTLDEQQKLRITKNHIQRVMKKYVNNIIAYAPGVQPVPKNEKEMQDVKAAELNRAVWQHICNKVSMPEQVYDDALDFNIIGEVAMKIFWDPTAGKFLGWEQEVDEMGQPVVDEMGQPVASKRPVFGGDIVYERIYGFNLLRSAHAKHMSQNDVWIIRKMVDKHELEKKYGNDEEKKKFLQTDEKDTFLVFEGVSQGYKKSENEILVREFFIKPCYEYPLGYFLITTQAGILEEGELPSDQDGAIWPIIYAGYDPAQTTPRHYSAIKQLRPLQIEINRSASKQAEAQITTGDDKLLYQAGTKLSPGATLSGTRGIQYSGQKPEYLQGRVGEQYQNYSLAAIDEFYKLANVEEDAEELMKQADPFAQLFFSVRDKKKFAIYSSKFERFQIAKCFLSLRIMKLYASEEMLIPAIGRNERVNISEFKNTNPLSVEIKIKPMNDDIETMFGKQLVMNTALQYVGNKLEKEDIGRIIRNMPFGNADESFSDLTLSYDTATNIILALDRGETPQILPYADNKYIMKRLSSRMTQSDFLTLAPQIQQNYQMMLKQYEAKEQEELMRIQAAEAGFIPSGGAKVAVDYYVEDPQTPNKVSRAKLPAEAIDWLIKRLAEQGTSQQSLRMQSQGVNAEIADAVAQNMGPQVPLTQPVPSPQDSDKVQPIVH